MTRKDRRDQRVFYSFGRPVPELSDACDAEECGSCWRSGCGCACHEPLPAEVR